MSAQVLSVRLAIAFLISIAGLTGVASAQRMAFDSHSDGSDGALDFAGNPNTTIDFNPFAFDPPLDPDGDQVFHFTTINIPQGKTVRLRWGSMPNGPVYWLATGAVTIGGTIDLNGENGVTTSTGVFVAAQPGPGGFPGGFSGNSPTLTGFGPGAGGRNGSSGVGGGYGTAGAGSTGANGGGVYGNQFLLPLIGGSGGGTTSGGHGGGAGGGAILVASNSLVQVTGSISARGGAGGSGAGGGGSGGAVRIIAPTLSISGSIEVRGGSGAFGAAGSGRIRLEAASLDTPGSLLGVVSKVRLTPHTNFLAADEPRLVRVTAIAGEPVPANPAGNVFSPDVTIDQAGPVSIDLSARQIPIGTMLTLYVWSDTDGMQVIPSTPLAGTFEDSSATATATFSAGVSQIFVRAVWTP